MTNTPKPLELDVGPLLEQGRPPLPAILQSVARLSEGQAIRIKAPFDPAPLRDLLQARGFDHVTTKMPDGTWLVEFTPHG